MTSVLFLTYEYVTTCYRMVRYQVKMAPVENNVEQQQLRITAIEKLNEAGVFLLHLQNLSFIRIYSKRNLAT